MTTFLLEISNFTGVLLGLLILLALLGVRSTTTLFHELGHALPALVFTSDKVVVLVGSYGATDNSLHCRLGRLEIFLKFNFLRWNLGLCSHQGTAGLWSNFLILLGGPIASLIVAIPLLWLFNRAGLDDYSRFFIAVFLISAVWDFLSNIIPIKVPVLINNGQATYNDGYQILLLFRSLTYSETFKKAIAHRQAQDYEAEWMALQQVMEEGKINRTIQEAIIQNRLSQGEAEAALGYFNEFWGQKKWSLEDNALLAQIHIQRKDYYAALEACNAAVYKAHTRLDLLLQRAEVFTQLSEHRMALDDLNAAYFHQPQSFHAFAQRAYALLQLGQLDEAYSQLQHALTYNSEDAKSHLYFALYYQKIQQPQKALEYLENAERLGVNYPGLAYLIETTKAQLT